MPMASIPEAKTESHRDACGAALRSASSKKVENLEAAVALHFMWYNFGRVHQTLRVTPGMEAGLSDHVWTMAEVVALLEVWCF